jgi:hypothetical protein
MADDSIWAADFYAVLEVALLSSADVEHQAFRPFHALCLAATMRV